MTQIEGKSNEVMDSRSEGPGAVHVESGSLHLRGICRAEQVKTCDRRDIPMPPCGAYDEFSARTWDLNPYIHVGIIVRKRRCHGN